MPGYTAPIRDMQFVLHEMLDISSSGIAGYPGLDRDLTAAILEEAGRLARDVLAPLNAVGDREGCRLEDGKVFTPTGFVQAFSQLREGGWPALDCDAAYGGQGMPYLLTTATGEMFAAANMSLNMYQGLTHGAYSAIHAHGTEAQKATYLPRLASCEWTGTMNLTEPQAGTDLGLLRTRATEAADGSYRVSGQKIFISAGEHDLAANIIHLVLAKVPGGGDGTRGISLFIVPKFLVNPDGSLGERNAVSVGGLESKMGIHGSATCVMNYDGAHGWLLGDLHKGMRAMFTMMNEARLAVGLQGYAQAYAAYLHAADYARTRRQGHDPAHPQKADAAPDPLIVHPDIRRNLMDQKSFVEGARALTFWAAMLIDAARRSGDKAADGLVSLMIPVLKGFLTDKGFAATVGAQQVFGGHGYIEEQGMSQFVRDARITMIYEGANGVQALDLVGRKLGQDGGRQILAFFDEVRRVTASPDTDAAIRADFLDPLQSALVDLQSAVGHYAHNGIKNPQAALAGSDDFLHLFGHVCLGLMWARAAIAAQAGLRGDGADTAFYQTKLATGRYYMVRHLPATRLHLTRILTASEAVLALGPEAF